MTGRRPAVLFASAHLPSPRSREAGQRIAYRHLAWLAERYRVLLVSWCNAQEREDLDPGLHELCASVDLVPVDDARRLINALSHPLTPLYVAVRQGRPFARAVSRVIARERPALLWAEYNQLATLGALGLPSVIVCHDVMSQLWERRTLAARGLKRALLSLETARLRRWERQHLARFARVVALSEKDRDVLASLDVAARCGYPALDVAERQRSPALRAPAPTVVFLGALGRAENDDAMRWFLECIWPMVRQERPDARLAIVGGNPSAALRRAAATAAGVEVTGFVADPTELLETAWVAVAPLRLGAGIKVKVLEYLARGTAVVATPVGAEGIEADCADGLSVAEGATEFAREVVEALRSNEEAAARGARAAAWFRRDYLPRRLDASAILRLAAEALATKDAPKVGAGADQRQPKLLVGG